jgi:arylsulfatase A-like enzyme
VIVPMGAAIGVRRAAGPDVIVLLIDALRADHLGAYGYGRDTSPNIDEFAGDAVLFEQAISASGFTKTSIASLFTGIDPHSHGVFRGNRADTPTRITSDVLAPDFETVAEAMTDHGLFSVAWVMNPQLQDFMGFDQGFAPYNQDAGRFYQIRNGFLSWLSRIGRFGQFFAYLHVLDLHDPYHPPDEFNGMFGEHADLFSDVDLSAPGAWSRLIREIRDGEREVSDLEVEQLRADYDAVIRSVDVQVGILLDALRAKGTYDDAIIVITSDHGDGFMEHGFISHSTTPYDELVRIPLLIKLPDSKHAGRRISEQVRAVDLAPTLLELVGAPEMKGVDGRSLLPLVRDSSEADHPSHAFVEETGATGIRTESWKALYFLFEGNWEIYDLRADPLEQNDLSDDPPEEVQELQLLVLQAVEERSRREAGTVPLDEETVEALRSLGYIE